MGARQLEFSQYAGEQLQSEYYRKLPTKNFVSFGVIYINMKKKVNTSMLSTTFWNISCLTRNILDELFQRRISAKKK